MTAGDGCYLSKAEATDRAVIAPTPGADMNSRAVAFVRATARDLAIQNLDAVEDRQSSLHEVLHNEAHWWRGIKLTGHDLVGTPGEPAGCLAKQNPEGAKQSSDSHSRA